MSTTPSTAPRHSGTDVTDGITTGGQEEIIRSTPARTVLGLSRIVLGFYFLWAFIDKTFGLGFATPREGAWINGGTPAQGFMNSVEGPTAGFFQAISGAWADWLFMIGLLGIGLALILGIGLKLTAILGTLLVGLMWLAMMPIGQPNSGYTNPLVDSHWIQALSMWTYATTRAGDTFGLGKVWHRLVGDSILR